MVDDRVGLPEHLPAEDMAHATPFEGFIFIGQASEILECYASVPAWHRSQIYYIPNRHE